MTDKTPPSARLLDVTRLASRAGRRLTGVDRVERAYLAHLLTLDVPVFGLARVVAGYALLDRAGLAGLLARIDGVTDWGNMDLISRLGRRLTIAQRRADTDLRRLAVARAGRTGLRGLLARHLPSGTAYLNVGHSNLTQRVLAAVRALDDAQITVMIHDVIPLDLPEFQREGTVRRFVDMLKRVGRMADLIICNSEQTRQDVQRTLLRRSIRAPASVVAHLGVDLPAPMANAITPKGPYFVAVGTIEPRKNHTLLLDIWEELAKEDSIPPTLYICGARGWRNEDVFARLDALPADGPVRECPDLSDPELAALVAGARALLQPSFAEGYGLPPIEAAALQTPVICADLPVFHEVLGDIPVYLSPVDRYPWVKKIKNLAEADGTRPDIGLNNGFVPPSWRDHFNIVLMLT
ncbi:glycosyltransferase family 1 protein [Pseudooceanicola sp.]|uniref:glycosyltransferase family 4 protein n=1 Tax=Pseudooceanicola sp. TaxID=1914328 RepID=UPI002628B107|nr:glycosyltransferase family 1 protein [Pseudooceanicola sp.]MDF1856665.1 glycosyltransferase family 1 protein [Pseudooceanicola sp.]